MKIEKCPFCGGEADTRWFAEHDSIQCDKCGLVAILPQHGCGNEHIAAWNRRALPENNPCADCSGIVYRQTNSGKIIPANQRCAAKITPPCYQPDGDGCAYQIYGDNDDEPINQCKACPLCYSDKVRHKQPENKPLTCEGCDTCVNRDTDSYRYYTYPCNECKHRARDSYERGPQEAEKGETNA